MKLREYLDVVVRPNIEELIAHFADVRAAHNAIHSVDALAAHLFVAAGGRGATGAPDDTYFREGLAANNAEFRLVRDLAKAAKHVELTRGNPEARTVSSVANLKTQSLGWGVARWDEGRWGSPPQVTVTTDAGDVRVVETVLVSALRFLEAEMDARGL